MATKAVILAPGAWLTDMSRRLLGIEIPTRVTAETVSYHPPIDPSEAASRALSVAGRMPVFVADVDNGVGDMDLGYYGIPIVDVPGVKVSAHHAGAILEQGPAMRPVSAGGNESENRGVVDAAAEKTAADTTNAVLASNQRFIQRFFGGMLTDEPCKAQSCMYTATPDHDYVLGPVPGRKGVFLAGGGSGHAFKMGPAIGEALACAALGEELPYDMAKFAVDRGAMREGLGEGGEVQVEKWGARRK